MNEFKSMSPGLPYLLHVHYILVPYNKYYRY